MSTSTTHQQSLADIGFETRPPMLERGSYIPWASRFRRYLNQKRENRKWLNKVIDEGSYQFKDFTPSESEPPWPHTEKDLTGDYLKHYEAEIEAMNLILISIPNDIYSSMDACTNGCSEDPLTSAMILLARAITQRFSNPTNNRLCTSSNTRNQANVQADRADSKHEFWSMILHFSVSVQTPSINYENTLFAKDNQELKFPKQSKIINDTFGDDQIDSNIIFDEPKIDVNSGSVECDNNVQESYKLEQLARNGSL
ncbi:hypothetical protein Tco_0529932 [Tanacetum coccineum]